MSTSASPLCGNVATILEEGPKSVSKGGSPQFGNTLSQISEPTGKMEAILVTFGTVSNSQSCDAWQSIFGAHDGLRVAMGFSRICCFSRVVPGYREIL
jgi:hypothetical protein